VDYTNCWCS